MTTSERQVIDRIHRLGGIHATETELRYQLHRRDQHPLAHAPELLELLADLERQGFLRAELTFRLTDEGREEAT